MAIGVPLDYYGWSIVVDRVTPDATEIVLAHDPVNDPPSDGKQFFMAHLTATYLGEREPVNFPVWLYAHGPEGGVTYGIPYLDLDISGYCGVIPDVLNGATVTVFRGGTVSGNLCWQVTTADAAGLVLVAPDRGDRTGDRYFSLIPGFGAVPAARPTATPEPTRTPSPPGESRQNPVPIGTPQVIYGWTFVVDSVNTDATGVVLAADTENVPPPPGVQYVMVNYTVTNTGSELDPPLWWLQVGTILVGPSSIGYGPFSDECGWLPDQVESGLPIELGTSRSLRRCWAVRSTDAPALVLLALAKGRPANEDRWFSLVP